MFEILMIFILVVMCLAVLKLCYAVKRLEGVEGADRRLVTADAKRPEEQGGEEQRSVDDMRVTPGEAEALTEAEEVRRYPDRRRWIKISYWLSIFTMWCCLLNTFMERMPLIIAAPWSLFLAWVMHENAHEYWKSPESDEERGAGPGNGGAVVPLGAEENEERENEEGANQ